MNKLEMTQSQRNHLVDLDAATELALAYAAPEVPPMGNLTPTGLLEDFGRLNAARKLIEKTEKIVKERLISQLEGATKLTSDNFTMSITEAERVALHQTKAKAYLESEGILEDFMAITPTSTVRVAKK